MSNVAKNAIRALGILLAAISISWIVYRFVRTGVIEQLLNSSHVSGLLCSVCVAIPIYAVGLCCAGLAWFCLQTAFLPKRPPLVALFATYATTQFAKYLPGNVGHYVGRHLILRRLGMSHRAILLASLGEAGFLVLASLVWTSSALTILWPKLGLSASAWQVLVLECAGLGVSYAGLQWWRSRHALVEEWVPLHSPSWLLLVLPLELLLFAAMALALMSPAFDLLSNTASLWLIPAAAAGSWVAGFLVVGAPAGIGVRELVFLALLRGHMQEADILLLAAAFRIITFGGDIVILLLGLVLGAARVDAGSADR